MHSMPMYASRLIAKVIYNIDDNCIPQSCSDSRTRPLTIYSDCRSPEAIRVNADPSNVPIEGQRCSIDAR